MRVWVFRRSAWLKILREARRPVWRRPIVFKEQPHFLTVTKAAGAARLSTSARQVTPASQRLQLPETNKID